MGFSTSARGMESSSPSWRSRGGRGEEGREEGWREGMRGTEDVDRRVRRSMYSTARINASLGKGVYTINLFPRRVSLG